MVAISPIPVRAPAAHTGAALGEGIPRVEIASRRRLVKSRDMPRAVVSLGRDHRVPIHVHEVGLHRLQRFRVDARTVRVNIYTSA
eukprot:CAMPEP_0172628006 /NCGR_PEP_ID=MMETSP1068-20121228/159333_1 /TAXON_ID=35684 /ORGANISM="Pseudopedinella elastica, Strain CCMP716" /LENGTH=84 /DNA_ID=CAMNT_0013438053 /DNA_START=520 /DNA_END=774 /DNA_ORIENTATION=+